MFFMTRSVVSAKSFRLVQLLAVLAVGSCQTDQRFITGAPRAPHPDAAVASSPSVDLSPTGDTFLNVNTQNYSTNSTLNVYTWPDNTIANAIVMQFDLSSIPQDPRSLVRRSISFSPRATPRRIKPIP